MYRVDLNTNDITITRGDSAVIKLTVDNSDGTLFQPSTDPQMEFQCCQGIVTLVPSDTNGLAYGTYNYKVIVILDGKQISAINGAKFIVQDEVTF